MKQRRICEYLGLGCTHFRSYLHLPQAIRHRIYIEAGLVHNEDIDLHNRSDASESWLSYDNFILSYNLLLTCRAIYTEVSSIIYSTNRFFIQYNRSLGLRPLLNLRPQSISLLTHLTVHLNVTSCPVGQPCCKTHPGKQKTRHTTPLVISSHRHRAILSDWRRAANYVTSHITSSRLHLDFICDVEGLAAATYAVEPLLNVPILSSCSIRLSQQANPPLQHLAVQTAARAVGAHLDHQRPPFRFLDLPREIRRQVLEYTDLVSPLCEVEWNPDEGFYLRYSSWRCGGEWDCPPGLHYACQFRNCWEYSNTGCFCRRYHAAYSSTCHCWSPPTPLFSVCRSFQQDCQDIFFEKNRFIITPSKGCTRTANETPTRLEISTLTKALPVNALGYIRYLEIVFPPFDEDYLRPHEPAYQDWLEIIDYVRDKLNLSALTLRVYMADYDVHGHHVTPFRRNMTKEQGKAVVAMYFRALTPLSKLNQVSRLFLHLAWPFTWTRAGRQVRRETPERVKQQIATMEQRLESLVIGDAYNSMRLGKNREVRSQWLEASRVLM